MQRIAHFVEQGGFFMWVNFLVSAITIAVIAERASYFLGRGHVNGRAFLDQIRKLVSANNVDRAIKLCSATGAPIAKVAKAGLARLNKGEAAVATSIEETLVDVTPDLKKRISTLWSLANIATLLGLLGTISGLIATFEAVAYADAATKSERLAKGISEAMNNTWLGLLIAVTCMVGHLFLSALSKKQLSELESFSLKLENFLAETSGTATAGASDR
jgi:biopolymer transport protein ExbB/TolQ